jgi:hypothetical protein
MSEPQPIHYIIHYIMIPPISPDAMIPHDYPDHPGLPVINASTAPPFLHDNIHE